LPTPTKDVIVVNMKKYIWGGIVVVIIIIIGVYAVTRKPVQAGGYNLGVIAILSGDYAVVGENIRNGVILADEQYNQAHPDAKVNVTIEDDGFNAGTGVSAYQKLVNVDHIDALINVSTPTIDAIYTSVVANGMPVIQGGEQGRAPSDDNVFGLLPDSVSSEHDYGVYMREKGVKEMAIVYSNLDAMVRFVAAFKSGFQGSTTDVVINQDQTDYRTQAAKLAGLNPSTIGFFMVPAQGAQFINELNKVDKNKPQIFFDANFQSGFSDYQRILGNTNVLNGAIVGTLDSGVSDAFKQAYKARFGSDPGFMADLGYDGFNLLASTHSADKATWVQNIKDSDYTGVSGTIKFTSTGNRQPKTKMMTVQGGQLVDLK